MDKTTVHELRFPSFKTDPIAMPEKIAQLIAAKIAGENSIYENLHAEQVHFRQGIRLPLERNLGMISCGKALALTVTLLNKCLL